MTAPRHFRYFGNTDL